MSGAPSIEPALLVREANQSDLVRRKLDMDALRKRLGDTATKQEKLRESCEGFESIFLQKMWEQMRKTVSKEGYLHSKDEEAYQSLFDVELCKKMASAGGIGLADMLYAQLSQQLEDSGRTTTPSTYRRPLEIAPSDGIAAAAKQMVNMAQTPLPEKDKKLTADDLYSALSEDDALEEEREDDAGGHSPLIEGALSELKAALNMMPDGQSTQAAQHWAEKREAAVNAAPFQAAAKPAATRPAAAVQAATGQAVSEQAAAAEPAPAEAAPAMRPSTVSWQGPGPVSAKPKPISLFGRSKPAPQAADAAEETKPAAPPRGMAPQDTLWPLAGEQGEIVSRFGWEDDPASGKRRWNAGITIAAQPGAPVRAVLGGTVVYAGERDGFGNTVVLEHKDGYRSYYSNLGPTSIRVGENIKHGAEFAKLAVPASPSTNGENSASLHFELKKGEMALNPASAIRRQAAAG